MTTVKLRKPIKAHGEDLAALELREPVGKDIRECGMPYKLESKGDSELVVIDAGVSARYIARLAGIPLSSVDQLTAPDFNLAVGAVLGFFGVGEGSSPQTTSSPSTSTPPTSGATSSTSSA